MLRIRRKILIMKINISVLSCTWEPLLDLAEGVREFKTFLEAIIERAECLFRELQDYSVLYIYSFCRVIFTLLSFTRIRKSFMLFLGRKMDERVSFVL